MTSRKILPALGAALLCAASCVYVDDSVGSNFIPKNQIYDVVTTTVQLDHDAVWMENSDNLSSYSSNRITIGTLKGANDGDDCTFRASAFSVQPIYGYDEIDIGTVQEIQQFHFHFEKDSIYCKDAGQRYILQNVRVYALKDTLGSNILYSSQFDDALMVDRTGGEITLGTPVYAGGDSLGFDLKPAFAQKFIDAFAESKTCFIDNPKAFLKKIPGIYMEIDNPLGEGGRINMFRAPITIEDSYYIKGGYAELKVKTLYSGSTQPVDTSFFFYYGPADRTKASGSQYAFNICRQPSDKLMKGQTITDYTVETDADGRKKVYYDSGNALMVEGGTGLKPVVSAKRLRELILADFPGDVDPSDVVINKASLVFPFEPADQVDYSDMVLYPSVLSPTCKIMILDSDGNEMPTFAGLTDSSVSTENQGDLNRSRMLYSPDISHHVQEIIRLKDDADFADYDIWLLVMAYETITTTTTSSSSYDDEYYSRLAYANYYNSIYGDYYGYGGYGYGGYGYGGYDSYYNNYYNYYMMAAMMSGSGSSTTTSQQLMLDTDRYYEGRLGGPALNNPSSPGSPKGPHLNIIYSIVHREQ